MFHLTYTPLLFGCSLLIESWSQISKLSAFSYLKACEILPNVYPLTKQARYKISVAKGTSCRLFILAYDSIVSIRAFRVLNTY